MTTKSPSGFAVMTLRGLAASALIDAEPEFRAAFPLPVLLFPTLLDDEEDGAARRTETRKLSPLQETHTDTGSEDPTPRDFGAYMDAAIVSLGSETSQRVLKVTVGRARENDIALPAGTVSSRHGSFTRDKNGVWCYMDLGSRNGSWVAGVAVPGLGAVTLADGDEIAIGREMRALFRTTDGLLTMARRARANAEALKPRPQRDRP